MGTASSKKTDRPHTDADLQSDAALLLWLPQDVWNYIFKYMSQKTLFNCSLVSKAWYQAIEENIWRKKTMLHCLSNLLDLGTCEILNTLRKETPWKHRYFYLESLPRELCTSRDYPAFYDGEKQLVHYDDSTRVLTRTTELNPLTTFADRPFAQLKSPRFSNWRIINKFHSIAQSISNSPTLGRLRSPTLRRSPSLQRTNSASLTVPNKFEELFYFEITLQDGKVNGQISAGIGICEEGFPADTFVGWRYDACGLESIAYHADDGLKRCCDDFGKPYGPKWDKGDTVGVGLHFVARNEANVFFTNNGNFLGIANTVTGRQWFPSVGHSMKAQMKVNFGQEPFVFDVTKYMDSCKQPRDQKSSE